MKKEIELFDYTEHIMKAVKSGVLLTTKAGAKVNMMTISWGVLGIEWQKPIFITFVRENRFTRTQLDENPEFTVNIPYGEYDKKILGFCGTKSGKNVDKVKELALELVDSDCIKVPAVKQLPLTLECKVLYKQMQDKNSIPEYIQKEMYPENVDSSHHAANKDYHIAYYGEIVKAYIVE